MKQRVPCACGCGQLALPGRRYIYRHHLKGATHPRYSHGLNNSAEHKVWRSMLARCKRQSGYVDRGIVVCERWHSFANFIADMGPRPTDKHSIDRIDNNGPYAPSNCRWATRSQQNYNRRPLRHEQQFTWEGETLNITQWAKRLDVKLSVLVSRRARGWSVEKTITTPVIHRHWNH